MLHDQEVGVLRSERGQEVKHFAGIFHVVYAHAVVILGTCSYAFLEAVDLQS